MPPFGTLIVVADLKPRTERPSSVRVPVLSKTKVSICPAKLMRGGEMQNIFRFLSLFIAKIIPHDIAAGNAGGTAIVIKSREWSISDLVVYPDAIISGNVAQKPTMAIIAIKKTNFIESLLNLKCIALG